MNPWLGFFLTSIMDWYTDWITFTYYFTYYFAIWIPLILFSVFEQWVGPNYSISLSIRCFVAVLIWGGVKCAFHFEKRTSCLLVLFPSVSRALFVSWELYLCPCDQIYACHSVQLNQTLRRALEDEEIIFLLAL